MNDNLKTSQNGLEFITKWEGCVLKPYKDVAGLRTIGVGHLIKSGEDFPDGVMITKERALEILAQDVEHCEKAIKRYITVPLNQNQFDALISFGFNCGAGVYSNSNVASAVNSLNLAAVPEKLMAWSNARINGVMQPVTGLVNRRRDEGELFMKPDPNCVIKDFPIPWTKESLANAQQKLQALGLYNINIDGLWGPGSERAVTEFASLYGIELIVDPSKGVSQTYLDALAEKAGF